MDDATVLVRAKTALEELGSAAAHRIGERRAERLVDDVSAGLVELARVNQAAIGELLAERDEARADAETLRQENERLRGVRPQDPCGCQSFCGDDGDVDGPGTCKGLPREPEPPLVEIVVAHRAALAAAQEPPAYTPAPECPRCGLFLAPGEVHGEHEVGCVAQEPPAAPCYVCGHPVAEGEGWRRDSKTWCPDHRPVWSHD